MLIIRTEQLSLLGAAHAVRIERELVQHVARHFPEHESQADAFVHAARLKAATYALVSERDLYRFVNLCAVEGLDFDQHAKTAWMRDMLLDQSITSASERMRLLTSRCLHLDDVERTNALVVAPAVAARPEWMR